MAERRIVSLEDSAIEVVLGADLAGAPVVCAAHPVETFGPGTVELLAGMVGARVVCVNPWQPDSRGPAPPGGPSLEWMVDRIEDARRTLGFPPWIFWGMSGGGWLAELYARRYPEALGGTIIESVCACFRERLADPDCVLSPFFPAWREPLRAAGLLSERSHREPSSGDETEWVDVNAVGHVFRRRGGPALLVSPGPIDPEMRRLMPRFWDFDARPWLGGIRTPALVLCGGQDPLLPVRHARAVHEAVAGSTFVEIEGAGHVPVSERRPEVSEAFRQFVRRLDG